MAARYTCIQPSGYDYTGDANENARYAAGYASLSLAEAGEGGGTLSDDLYIEIIHGSGANIWDSSPDTTKTEFDGWDCGAYTVYVKTLLGTEYVGATKSRPAFENGALDTTEYILKVDGNCIEVDNDHDASEHLNIEFKGVQFESHTTAAFIVTLYHDAQLNTAKFDKCWFEHNTDSDGISLDCNDAPTVEIVNCVLDGNNGTGDQAIDDTGSFNGAAYIYNCSIFGWNSICIYNTSGGTFTVKNCMVGNNSDDFGGTPTVDYCCSDDGDGNNPVAVSGADWDNEIDTKWTNLNLEAGGNCRNAGLDQNSDARVPSDDIAGTTRPAGDNPVSIGAYDIVAGEISGETCWGHVTAVIEDNVRTFVGNWTGTGTIGNSGDTERLELNAGEYMISEVVDTDTKTVILKQNHYDPTGDDVDMDYRHGASVAACEVASWNNYTVPFVSLGYVQVKMTSTL